MLLVLFRIGFVSTWIMVPVIAVMVYCLVHESRAQKQLVDQEMHPRQRELEALRAKLADPER